jgi:ribosomal protein S18 acetylase RimI-like enzyme
LTLPVGVRLKAIREADFGLVARLAKVIWESHYVTMISMAQIGYMLAERCAPENLRAYLGSDTRGFEILWLEETPVGYCSYALHGGGEEMKLEQLYLLPAYRGRGLGRFMLNHIEAEACKRNARWLVLQVNRQNARAIAIYRKAGFRVRSEAVFDIGEGFCMDDYVMEKAISQ